MPRLDAFTRAYVEAALWSSTDESNDQGGDPLDANYSIDDIAPETMELIVEDAPTSRRSTPTYSPRSNSVTIEPATISG